MIFIFIDLIQSSKSIMAEIISNIISELIDEMILKTKVNPPIQPVDTHETIDDIVKKQLEIRFLDRIFKNDYCWGETG